MHSVRTFFIFFSNSDPYLLYAERVVLSIVETDTWIKELMVTVNDRKRLVESYIGLLSKESKYLNTFRIIGY
jgi:hypothetical protein